MINNQVALRVIVTITLILMIDRSSMGPCTDPCNIQYARHSESILVL